MYIRVAFAMPVDAYKHIKYFLVRIYDACLRYIVFLKYYYIQHYSLYKIQQRRFGIVFAMMYIIRV